MFWFLRFFSAISMRADGIKAMLRPILGLTVLLPSSAVLFVGSASDEAKMLLWAVVYFALVFVLQAAFSLLSAWNKTSGQESPNDEG